MNYFLLFLPLTIFCFEINQNIFTDTKNEAVEFELGQTVYFNLYDNNYFKFDYNPDKENNTTLFLILQNEIDLLNLKDPDDNTYIIKCNYFYETYTFELNLTKSGIYYFEFISNTTNNFLMADTYFMSFIPGRIIDIIDLSKNMYYSTIKLETFIDIPMYSMYKVQDLSEDKYVFFSYEKSFYFDDNYSSPFKICKEDNDECVEDVKLYKFSKEHSYTIYINFVNYNDTSYYFYFPFLFFPISQKIIKNINPGYYTSLEPILYYFQIKNNQNLYAYFTDCQNVFISLTNEKINQNNLENLENLNFQEISENEATFNSSNYGIIISIPKINKINIITSKVVIAHDILYSYKDEEINIPQDKSKIIYFKNDLSEEENPLELYNILTTYSSSENNMRFIYNVEKNHKADFFIQNNQYFPIYVDKSSNDTNLNITTLKPKFAFFSAINQDLFKMYLINYIKGLLDLDISYSQIFPLNFRVNSNLNIFYDFFNFYFYNFEDKINLYINQFYGNTDLYECEDDLIKNKDLSILKNPILNCKGKKSAFNRPMSLKDTKLLTGYLSHNSYFDIYLDFDYDNDNKIRISPLSKIINNSTSKYLKQKVEYIIDFTANHLVKLDPAFNAKVTIFSENEEPKILNSENPICEIVGKNIRIQADSDAMVYFYGKIFDHIKQIPIENKENAKIIQIKSNSYIYFTIDIGFEGYNPLNIELFTKVNKIRYNTVIYLENIYNKLQNKLVKNEQLYLYYTSKEDNIEDDVIDINYINNNIENQKNEYSLNVIKSDSLNNKEENNIVIDNRYIEYIIYRVNFCKAPHKVKMYYEGQASSEKELEFNETNRTFVKFLDKYGTKIKFNSNQDFIFSYSFKDYTDQLYDNNNKWLNERKVLNNLTITEISLNNKNNNSLLIKFYPNYKNSVTKYIIIVASKDDNNTLSNFNNPCYVTELLIERPNGVKVANIYDIGEKDLIDAVIDISDILNKDNMYIVNIISEELRFDKNLNYYTPKSFTNDKNNDKNDDNSNNNNSEDKSVNTFIIIIFIILGIFLLLFIIILCRVLNRTKTSQNVDYNKVNSINDGLMEDIQL